MNRRAIFSHELLIELPHWESMGWISPEQAALLRSQYAIQTKSSDPWWHLVLSLFAILCVAAGVIALFASNWASLSRNVRVVLSLTPLLISQIALYSTFVRHPKSTAWRECSTLAVALSVGASIALIGQTYHVEADFSTFLRTWLWLILPLPYVARSWTAVFFAAFLTHLFGFSVLENGFYVSQSAAFFLHDASWEYLIYVLALLPWLYWQRRRKAFYGEQRHVWRTFSVTHTISFAVALTFSNIFDGFVPIWFCIAAFYLASRTLRPERRNAMTGIFQFTLALMLLFINDYGKYGFDNLHISLLEIVSIALCLFSLYRWRRLQWWDLAFATSGFLICYINGLLGGHDNIRPWITTLLITILGLWRARLDLNRSLIAVNAALIWVLMALFLRFIGDDLPLWLKGAVFIGAGIAFFIVNLHLTRRSRTIGVAS